tara:strand:- start:113 stop:616 length:504 start_codon:yes stop_codon:yes gene_type:complete
MKKIYFFFIIFLFFFDISLSKANDKIAFIDLNYILSESNEGKKILDKLEIDNNKNVNFFKSEETKLKQERENINKLKNILSQEEYNNKMNLFKTKVNNYNLKKSEMIKLFEDSKNSELNTFFSNLNEIMNNFMQENSINLILDKKNIVMANNKNDISDDILKIINKK